MSINELPDTYSSDGANGAGALKKASRKLKDGAAMVQDRFGDTAESARAYADRALGQLNTLSRSAVEKAKERPALSAAAILGVGLAIGVIAALALQRPARSLAESALDEAARVRRKLRL